MSWQVRGELTVRPARTFEIDQRKGVEKSSLDVFPNQQSHVIPISARLSQKETLKLNVPKVATAREAVAWTFGMSADEYDPLIET